MSQEELRKEPLDVLIVTAVKEEWDAVLAVDTGADAGSIWEKLNASIRLEVRVRNFQVFGGALRIAVIQALGMGGVEAVSAAAPLLTDYHIRCVAMCGVCAGRRGKVQLGDVIIADRMWTYDTGKQEEEQVKQDIDMYRIHPPEWKQRAERFVVGDAPWLAQRPRSYEAQGDWLLARVHAGGNLSSDPERATKCADFEIVVKKLWERGWLKKGTLTLTAKGKKRIEQKLLLHHGSMPEPKRFAVHCAPIASGSKVVEDSAIFGRLSTPVRKVLGVEMEASAIATLASHKQLEGAVVMKGVMDHADPDKSDNFKAFAARASAECLIAFLRENLPPRIGTAAPLIHAQGQGEASGQPAHSPDAAKHHPATVEKAENNRAQAALEFGEQMEATPITADLLRQRGGEIASATSPPSPSLAAITDVAAGSVLFIILLLLIVLASMGMMVALNAPLTITLTCPVLVPIAIFAYTRRPGGVEGWIFLIFSILSLLVPAFAFGSKKGWLAPFSIAHPTQPLALLFIAAALGFMTTILWRSVRSVTSSLALSAVIAVSAVTGSVIALQAGKIRYDDKNAYISNAKLHIGSTNAGVIQPEDMTAPVSQPVAASDTPQRRGSLKLPSQEPRYLNPVLETRLEKANMLVFEGLVGLNERLEPVPRLAKSWEQSPDGKVITFRLRKEVKWHDGKPFTADDVAFTYGAIQGSNAPTLWRAYMSAVETLETPDPHTVVVKYRYPYAPALSTWIVGILPKHVYGERALTQSPANQEPVGTGPYKLLRWEVGKRLVFGANPGWWNGRAYIDTIELVVDTPESIDALAEGQIDFANIEDIENWLGRAQMSDFRERFEVSDVIEASIQLVAWNLQKSPLDNRRVRQALTMALDRSRAIDDVLLGQARPLSGPFFPTMFGADPRLAPQAFDLEAAGKLLDQAGHPLKNGKRFRINMIALESQRGPVVDGVMAIFRSDLAQLGIDLGLELVSSRDFFQRIAERKFDALYFTRWPDIPDPDPYSLLHSSMIGIGANFPGYANPDVDRLLDQARATADRKERRALYHKVHRIVFDDLPYTPLFAPYGHYAWNHRVRSVSSGDVGSLPRFPGVARWWIAARPAHAIP